MHTSFAAIFLAVLAPMAALASPKWHPNGPPPHGPPPDVSYWHPGPPGPEPSATVSIAAGILPSVVSGFGSTGTATPKKLSNKYKAGVSRVAGADSTGTPKKKEKKKGTSASAPAASASVSLTSYD